MTLQPLTIPATKFMPILTANSSALFSRESASKYWKTTASTALFTNTNTALQARAPQPLLSQQPTRKVIATASSFETVWARVISFQQKSSEILSFL